MKIVTNRLIIVVITALIAMSAAGMAQIPKSDFKILEGEWDMTVDLGSEYNYSTCAFKTEGDSLQATWSGDYGEAGIRNITLEDMKVSFEFTIYVESDYMDINVSGTIENDTMSGIIGTYMGDFTFSASKRSKKK